MLLEGSDFNVSIAEKIYGVDVVESTITIGGRTLDAGTLLLTTESADTVGSNNLSVADQDVFALQVAATTLIAGSGNGAATASRFFDGSDVGFDTNAEGLRSVTLTVSDPSISVTGAATVNANTLYTLNLSAANVDAATLSWTINWGDRTIETVGNVASATHVYTQHGFTHNIVVTASDKDGTYSTGDIFLSSGATDSLFRLDGDDGTTVLEFADLDGLDNPVDVEIGPDGLIYATGFVSDDIRRYDAATGAFVDVFVSTNSGGLDGPARMAFGPDGHLYVTSLNTNEVLRYDGAAGTFLGAFVTAGSGALSNPDGIAFGADGNLYVSSDANGKILRYDGVSGAFIDTFVTTGTTAYTGLTFGPDGHLYVSDTGLNKVQRFDGTTGNKIDDFVTAGSGGIAGAAGLGFGSDGYLYVVGFYSDNVLRYDATDGSFVDEFISSSTGAAAPINLAFGPAHQVRVNPNAAPTANPDSASVNEGASVVIDLAGDDSPTRTARSTWARS